ncbi:MAG: glycine--tRNA ligase subunit beta, partial [Hyphomicrobiales bacterium]
FAVKDFRDYVKKLKAAKVILDPAERRRAILEGARAAAKAKRLELVEDEGLLAENAGLTEWPVPLMGAFDEGFLDVPPEVLTTSMKAHQKCFSVRGPSSLSPSNGRPASSPSPLTGEGRGGAKRSAPAAPNPSPQGGGASLSNHFILVANLVAKDRGKAIIEGNGRVIRARLSDAKFFWDQDCRHTLESRLPKLNELIFHARLGTVHDKAHAIARLAMDLSEVIPGANRRHCEQAALLAKADLVSGMVGEFPELQGIMGRYYALNDKLPADVADAIAQHYSPLGPNDAVPAHPTAIVAAISDKLYSLVGFFGIDERPTGSRDPYALRRSALGIIRIVLENNLRLSLREWFGRTAEVYRDIGENVVRKHWTGAYDVNVELLTFFHDRLKVYLRDRGARHDLIDAVISPDADDLLMIVARVEALGKFLDTDDGATLLAGVRRATSILRIEEKKDAREYTGAPDGSLYAGNEERALAAAIDVAKREASEAVAREDFAAAMRALAKLRAPVDACFDHGTVNADDTAL